MPEQDEILSLSITIANCRAAVRIEGIGQHQDQFKALADERGIHGLPQPDRLPQGFSCSIILTRLGRARTDACFIVRDGKAAKIWCKQRHMEYVVAAIG